MVKPRSEAANARIVIKNWNPIEHTFMQESQQLRVLYNSIHRVPKFLMFFLKQIYQIQKHIENH